jgi:small subunit ribosomal protein S16
VPVKIRLMRVGKTKQPSYRVVVADGRSPRDGRFLEILGTYAPRQEPSGVDIDADAAVAWLHKGAQPTESAHRLLTITGIWERYESERGKPARPPKPAETRTARKPRKEPAEAPAAPPTAAPAADAPAAAAPAADEPAADAAPAANEPAADTAPAANEPVEEAAPAADEAPAEGGDG